MRSALNLLIKIMKKMYNLLSSPNLISSFTICVLLICALLTCLWLIWLWLIWRLSSMIETETKEPFNLLLLMWIISALIIGRWTRWFMQTMKESFKLFIRMLETTKKLFNSVMRISVSVINKVCAEKGRRERNALQQKMRWSITFWIWVILATMYEMKQIKTGHGMNKDLSAFWVWILAHASESWFFWIYLVLGSIVWGLILVAFYYGNENPINLDLAAYPVSCALYVIVGVLTILIDYSDRSQLISVAYFALL